MLLLYLLRWLRENTKLDFKIALKKSGSLEAQFAEIAPTAVFRRETDSLAGRVMERLAPYRANRMLQDAHFRRELGSSRFALAYSNTIVNGDLLKRLPDQSCPVISHVHELDYMIRRFSSAEDLNYTLARTTRFIAGSEAVAANLVAGHGVERAKIDVVYEFIPSLELARPALTEAARRVRSELQIPQDAIVVGAAGTVDWRKGYDAFISLALEVCRSRDRRNVHFVWVGGNEDRRISEQIAYDLNKLGLDEQVRFVGHRSNYLDYLAMFDIFCLMSREDPFPLVVVEAAALGKPVVCFENSGGSPEFVSDGCGFVVPYLDCRAMAARVIELVDNGPLCRQLGAHGAAKALAHHTVAVAGPRIANIIERLVRSQEDFNSHVI